MRDTAENSRLPCRPSKAVQFRASKDSRKGGGGGDFSVFKELSGIYIYIYIYRDGSCEKSQEPFKMPRGARQLRERASCRYFRIRERIYYVPDYLYQRIPTYRARLNRPRDSRRESRTSLSAVSLRFGSAKPANFAKRDFTKGYDPRTKISA